jgi:uncharacterized protein
MPNKKIRSIMLFHRDPKNDYLLALAKNIKAEYLTIDDRDLLILESFEGTVILSYQNFISGIAIDIDNIRSL